MRRIWLFFLLLTCVGVADAQIRTGATIRGQVVAPGRINSGGIQVSIEKMPNRLVAVTQTDSGGNFEFLSLDGGRYEVVVRLTGYHETRQTVDLEAVADVPAESLDGDLAPPRITDTGGVDQSTVYFVLTRLDGLSDNPEIAALSRKYSRKIVQEYERAREDLRKNNPGRAAERLEAILKEAPDFFTAHNELGLLYQKQNRFRDGERHFKLARALNPLSALPLVYLGSLYLQEADANLEKDPDAVGGILDDALDALEEATKLEPHAGHAYYLLGAAYYKSSFFEEAEENLKRALEIERTSAARLMLINVYLRQENWPGALEHIDLFVLENPNSSNRAQILEIRSRVAKSIEGASR